MSEDQVSTVIFSLQLREERGTTCEIILIKSYVSLFLLLWSRLRWNLVSIISGLDRWSFRCLGCSNTSFSRGSRFHGRFDPCKESELEQSMFITSSWGRNHNMWRIHAKQMSLVFFWKFQRCPIKKGHELRHVAEGHITGWIFFITGGNKQSRCSSWSCSPLKYWDQASTIRGSRKLIMCVDHIFLKSF